MTDSNDASDASAPSRVERYLDRLDDLTGGVEAHYQPITSTHEGLAPVIEIAYRDLPDPGYLTAFTYGISLADNSQWTRGKPELAMTLRTDELIWARAMATMAERMRGAAPFAYGNVIDFGDRISPDSAMSAFLIFAPAVLNREDATGIDVADRLPINISGCYPIHADEAAWIGRHGVQQFWGLDWDPYDVHRPPAV